MNKVVGQPLGFKVQANQTACNEQQTDLSARQSHQVSLLQKLVQPSKAGATKPWLLAAGALALLMGCAFTSQDQAPLVFDGAMAGSQAAAGITRAVRQAGETRLRINHSQVAVLSVTTEGGRVLPRRIEGDEIVLLGEHADLQVQTTAGKVRVLSAVLLGDLVDGSVVPALAKGNSVDTASAQVSAPTIAAPASSAQVIKPAAAEPVANLANAPGGMSLKLDKRFESIQYAALFSYANGNLGPKAKNMLDRTAEAAQGAQAVNLVGRTDASGDRSRNVQIANGRVTAVRMYLVEKGVEPSIIKASTVVAEHAKDESGLEPLVRTQMEIKGVSVTRLSRRVDIGIEKPNRAAVAAQIKSGVL